MTRILVKQGNGTTMETDALGWVSNADGLCAVVRGADGVPKLEPVMGPDGARVVVPQSEAAAIQGGIRCECGQILDMRLGRHRCVCGFRYRFGWDVRNGPPRVTFAPVTGDAL